MISIITWDASFRESFHTIDFFAKQKYPKDEFEFLWVEFYKNDNSMLLEKISEFPNAKIVNLNHDRLEKWHLGKCLNAGIKEAKGDILVLSDGDVVVPCNILTIIEKEHKKCHELVLYFRRWDEPAECHDNSKSYHIEYLKTVCVLKYPTNYSGTISIKKECLAEVNHYEEHDVFRGPGANGLELYIRLRNKGFSIKWHNAKLYHPFHLNTGYSSTNRQLMNELSKQHPWIKPYAGIAQSWVLKSREMDLSYWADEAAVDKFLSRLPEINLP
jgi:hypothetical protein